MVSKRTSFNPGLSRRVSGGGSVMTIFVFIQVTLGGSIWKLALKPNFKGVVPVEENTRRVRIQDGK
jgi:hypothetical protein